MWYVYILKCKDGSLYTGITDNVTRRLKAHNNGKGGRYTRSHKPVRLAYSERIPTKSTALKREWEIKHWPREKKIKLIKK